MEENKDKPQVESENQSTPEQKETPKETIDLNEFQNLKKTVGQLSDTISKQNDFIMGASTVINTIAYDPGLKEQFKKVYSERVSGNKQGEEQNPQPTPTVTPKTPESDKRVDDVVFTQRETVIREFEKEYGFDSLNEQERSDARKRIATHMGRFGATIEDIPVSGLKDALEGSYMATHAEKLKQQGKLEGFVQARQGQYGMMGQFSGNAPTPDQAGDLTPNQKKWLKKLGVNEEEAKKTYLARDSEETRVSKAEQTK